jgi:hypothetical protein
MPETTTLRRDRMPGNETGSANQHTSCRLTSVEKVDKMTGLVLYTGIPIQVEPVTA